MINIKKFLNNVQTVYPNQQLFEDSFASLKNMSDDGRRNRAIKMPAYYKGIEQSGDGQARTFWEVPSASDSSTKYKCVVEVVVPMSGGLFTIAKSKWEPKKFSSVLKEADVRVSCSCPDFWWGGQTYNLGSKGKHKGNLAYGSNLTDLEPNIRDPKREHVLCKHLIAVFNVFPSNAFSIMGGARKYDANIETNPEATDDIEQGKAVLNKEQELFSIPKDDKAVITDSLYNGAEELAKNQDNEGTEEIIDERNQATEELDAEQSLDGTEEIIDEMSGINTEEQVTEPAPEVGEMIEERNINSETNLAVDGNTDEIIDEETESNTELEKDKVDEESEVSEDPNELLNRA